MVSSANRRVAILAHGGFPDRAKTALGIMRYGDWETVAIVDADTAGTRSVDHAAAVPDVPIVASVNDVPTADALVIGVAPIGGGFSDSWRPDVREALERGWDLVAGLHEFLSEDPEFAALAAEQESSIWDVRRPPSDLDVAEGVAADVDATVILTVGTDCSVGKMTTTFELVDALRERGVDAAPVPTGQTGIMIEGWGIPIDRVISDFVNGAIERLVRERGDTHDVLVVEGQGSITHPAYSAVTAGIVHGCMPDGLILCHASDRERVNGFERFSIPPISTVRSHYETFLEPVGPAPVIGGALNTRSIDSDETAREAVSAYKTALEAPASDVLRFGAEPLLEALP